MMHQKGNFEYCKILDKASVVFLPYGNKAYSMTFLLPEEGYSLEDLRLSLDSNLWRKIVNNKQERVVDVMIPSFESEYGTEDIRKILQDSMIPGVTYAVRDLMELISSKCDEEVSEDQVKRIMSSFCNSGRVVKTTVKGNDYYTLA